MPSRKWLDAHKKKCPKCERFIDYRSCFCKRHRPITDKHRQRVSESKRGKNNPQWGKRGKEAAGWRGGKMPEILRLRRSWRYKEWRRKVFERDNYTCQDCGDNRGGNLEADHIKSFTLYASSRFWVSNGVTLCKKCHRKTPNWGMNGKKMIYDYGRKNPKIIDAYR